MLQVLSSFSDDKHALSIYCLQISYKYLEETVFSVTAKFLLIRFEGKKRKYRLFRVLTHICIMVVIERIPKNHVILIHQVQSVCFQCCQGIFDCLTHFSPMSHFYTL